MKEAIISAAVALAITAGVHIYFERSSPYTQTCEYRQTSDDLVISHQYACRVVTTKVPPKALPPKAAEKK